jgi:hypothetical protein
MPIEWFKIEYRPSTRHIKDKEVKKNTMSTSFSLPPVHVTQLEKIIQNLKNKRLRHIKAYPITIDLPKNCLECNKVGNPIITVQTRARVGKFDFQGTQIKKTNSERWLRYNHTNGKHHRIGKYEMITTISKDKKTRQIPCIRLKKSLNKDLGYRWRFDVNSL